MKPPDSTRIRARGVIFDLDGTLLDTLADIADAFNHVLQQQGLSPHPTDAYRYLVGDGARVLAQRALPEEVRTDERIEESVRAYIRTYQDNPKMKARPYPGMPDLLDALTTRQIPMAVVSNKSHSAVVRCVSELLGPWRFDPVFGLRDGTPRKPDPAMALRVCEHLGLAPDTILFLGDTAVDMQTAVAAGMVPVGVLWGFRGEDELKKGGARLLLQRPLDLLQVGF